MKTSELSGALLDAWVARARGTKPEHIIIRPLIWGSGGVPMCHAIVRFEDDGAECMRPFRPSTNWEHGGPIIEREEISFFVTLGLDDGMKWNASADRFVLTRQSGPTALIAAMRAYVFIKFGDEVPDSHEAPVDSAK